MNIHEINVSELVAGSKFVSVDDGNKLYREITRLLSINDQVNIDFLGIDKINSIALCVSLGMIYNNWDNRVFSNIKYINVNDHERLQIEKLISKCFK